MIRPNDPNARVLPEDAGEIKMLWDYYAMALGPERLRQLVDSQLLAVADDGFFEGRQFRRHRQTDERHPRLRTRTSRAQGN